MIDLSRRLLTAAVAGAALAASAADAAAEPDGCKSTPALVRDRDMRNTMNAVRDLKKDGAATVNRDAQAVLDQLTDMFENDDSRYSAETAEAMRAFAGGRASRRQPC